MCEGERRGEKIREWGENGRMGESACNFEGCVCVSEIPITKFIAFLPKIEFP